MGPHAPLLAALFLVCVLKLKMKTTTDMKEIDENAVNLLCVQKVISSSDSPSYLNF